MGYTKPHSLPPRIGGPAILMKHSMEQCWVFDCFGRALHGSRVRGYGCKFKDGDVLGVLLNTADNSLYFFMQGAIFCLL